MEEPAVALSMADDTRRAFDSVAASYHRSNVENVLLHGMRQKVINAVLAHVPHGAHILDLGCGPGTDAERLGAHGYTVTAIDESPRMVEEARSRVEHANLADRVDVHRLGIEALDMMPGGPADAACSNFGPLNCVEHLDRAAHAVGRRLRRGGLLIASVIGRVCPWEIALYASRGDLARVRVRFARGGVPVPMNGHIVWTRYYTPGEFERPFAAAGFRRVALSALGLFAPPPYMQAFAERRPALVRGLERIDDMVGAWPVLRRAGDHFLIVLRKDV
jgi:SAM-dependent methyltransferase